MFLDELISSWKKEGSVFLCIEYKIPENHLLVLTFSTFFSESVLASSNGPLLVLDPGKASFVPELHVGDKGNSEKIA